MGPFFLVDMLGLDTVAARRRAPARVLRRPLLRPQGHEELVADAASSARRPAARASTSTASRTSTATRGRREELAELLTLKTLRRGVPGARGGRRRRPRDRPRPDGRRRADPRRGLFAAVHEGRRRRASTTCSGARAAPRRSMGERFAPPLSCAASSRRAASAPKSGQGFYPYPQPDAGISRDEVVKLETARRRRDRVARPTRRSTRSRRRSSSDLRQGVGRRSTGPGVRALVDRLAEPAAVLRRRRHQGVHADGRGRRRAS